MASPIPVGVGLCERIEASCAGVPEGAERMAIGNRRYIGLAIEQPDQARLMQALLVAAPSLLSRLDRYVEADLRLGEKQGAFDFPHRRTALDMIQGTITMAMHRAVSGPVPRTYVATLVLRGLGVPSAAAEAIARRPLPPLPPE